MMHIVSEYVCMAFNIYLLEFKDPFSELLLTDLCVTTHLITVNYIHLFTIRYFLQASQPVIEIQYS